MRPGELIDGRFNLVAAYRGGGTGEVLRGRDRESGGAVAVKILRDAGAKVRDRFEREARVLAGLAHDTIVRYVAHGATANGDLYLIMEWLEGENLGERIERHAMSVPEVAAIGARIAAALVHAHARGVVHRDVKPRNVFLPGGRAGDAKVLDFGLARSVGRAREITRTGSVVGTCGYMAPEQALGEREVDASADLFSLGCVLWEALVGRPPFLAPSYGEVLRLVIFQDAAPIRSLRPEAPGALVSLVEVLMSKDAGDRPSAAEAMERLARLGEARSHAANTRYEAVRVSVLEGPDTGKSEELSRPLVDIGRHARADFILTDRTVSRFHCEVRVDDGVLSIRDLGSRSRLVVGGSVVEHARLESGATVRLGESTLRVEAMEIDGPPGEALAGAEVARSVLLEGMSPGEAAAIASEIHRRSGRRGAPFVVVECARGGVDRLPATLREMSAGTLALRDVDTLDTKTQEGLRRALAISPSSQRARAVVSSCAGDLRAAVNGGEFSPELYYRLATVRLRGSVGRSAGETSAK